MPLAVIGGSSLATLALILYAIGIFSMLKRGYPRRSTVIQLACASACDLSATLFMMSYAGTLIPRDIHGWIGYSALLVMLVNLVAVIMRTRSKGEITSAMRAVEIIIFVFWACSYLMGAVKL